MKFPVALQLYSVRDELAADFEGTLKAVREMGYDGVEFAGLYGHSPEEIRDFCEKYHLVPVSAHVPFREMIQDPEAVIQNYRTIGCRFVVIPHIGPDYYAGNEKFDELIAGAKRLGEVAKSLGLQLGYHNHDFEFSAKLGDEYMLDAIYRLVPADLLKTQLDTCWVNVGGENPAEYIRKYAGRCPTVHLKDFVGRKSDRMYGLIGVQEDTSKQDSETQEFCLMPVGSGVQNFPEILKAAAESGAEWMIVEQDRPSMNKTPLECAKMSLDYLNTINL